MLQCTLPKEIPNYYRLQSQIIQPCKSWSTIFLFLSIYRRLYYRKKPRTTSDFTVVDPNYNEFGSSLPGTGGSNVTVTELNIATIYS